MRHAKLLVAERPRPATRCATAWSPPNKPPSSWTRSRSSPPIRTSASWPRRPCSARRGGCTPPTSPRPPATSCTSSTPRARIARPRGTSTAQDRAAHLGRYLAITEDGAGGVRLRGRGTVEDAATLRAALLPLTKPAPPARRRRPGLWGRCEDVRDHGARMWDAMVQTCEHALSHRPAPRRPRRPAPGRGHHHPRRPQGPIDWSPVTDDGIELSPATIRRLACDADIIPVVLGTRSEVLDVGRAHRLVTPALWRALVCRDRHCAFPGCTRPPVMGHAHHIRHWADGGPTALDNLVLLCGHHHRTIHHTPWQVRLNPDDGRPEFLPPPKPGRHHPAPEWIRQRARRE